MARKQSNTDDTEAFVCNDEGLYNMARRALRRYGNRRAAAKAMLEDLECVNGDLLIPGGSGAKFTLTGIINAMGNL